jgi:hypothetical protein
VIGFGLLMAAMQFFLGEPVSPMNPDTLAQIQQNPDLIRHPTAAFLGQHPEYEKPPVLATLGYLMINILLHVGSVYAFTMTYLRFAMRKNQPEYDVGGFFYWLGKILWKYIRPLLWVLLPIVGFFFYVRSLIRSAAVSPLAILQRGPELEASWEMTEGHAWRIFWNQICLDVFLGFTIFLILIIPGIILGIIVGMHGGSSMLDNFGTPAFRIAIGLVSGMTSSFMLLANSVFSCTVYRVLLQERKAASASLSTINPTSQS